MENRMIRVSILALTVFFASAWAQPSGAPPQPPVTDVQKYLSLTDAQVQSLQTIQANLRSSIATTRQQIATKQQTLNTQLSAGSTSAAVLGQELIDIQNLRNQVQQSRTSAQTQALGVLTADQKTKLATLTAAAALGPQIREAGALGLILAPEPPAGAPGGMGGPGMEPMGGRMMGRPPMR
jgi:Spy/CpxP family protein refolding chaperone